MAAAENIRRDQTDLDHALAFVHEPWHVRLATRAAAL
jgi:hypothetical protein